MKQRAVIIYGPPGAGKGTQAELLARRFQFIHFDTGRYLEQLFRGLSAEADSVLRKEKKLFDTGILCTPSWVLEIVSDTTRRIAESGFSITYSGSPRTDFEAFGDDTNRGLLSLLEEMYDRDHIFIIMLEITPETSIERNSHRVVCSVCGLPILAETKLQRCAFCSGPTRKRTLDNPDIIKVRLKEFADRTYPIIEGMESRGYTVKRIDGLPDPYKVHESVMKVLGISQ